MTDKEYAFEGEVIKLNKKDYVKICHLFSYISNMVYELEIMDMGFAAERPKKWYITMMYKLRYRNEQEKGNKL